MSGDESFRKVFTIWTSKLLLIENLIKRNLFFTNYFVWVDSSVARFTGERKNWNFMDQEFSKNHLYHYSSIMQYFGTNLNLNASFMLSHKNIWHKILELYKIQLEKSKDSNYAHDEETILNLIYSDNRDLFCKIDKLP